MGDELLLKTFKAFKEYAGSGQNGHALTDEEVRITQSILLEIMDDFDAMCRKHNLCHFLTGGSALGAFRENGFVPWDDDIDIMMPRKDYDQLPQIAEKEFGDKYWVQNLKTSETFDLCFTKFRKNGTRFVELFESEPERAGFFLDVFPLEDTYDNPVVRFVNGIIDEALFFIASCVRIHQQKDRLIQFFNDPNIRKSIRLKSCIGSVFDSKKDKRKWYKRCEKWQSKCNNPDSRYTTVSCGRGHYFGEMYTRNRLFPLIEHEFEGKRYFIPKECEHLLMKLYGSGYMKKSDPGKIEKHVILTWEPEKN